MKAVFDTNILIDYLNGVPQAKAELEQYRQKLISIVTWMEVRVGARSNEESRILHGFLQSFIIMPLNQNVAEMGVQVRQAYRLKLPDAIIYATARSESCLFVTRNHKDFDASLPDVRVPYGL